MAGFLDAIFNPWLGPILYWPSILAILIISVGITFLITIVYKYTTDQKEMKRIKDDLKKYQDEMKNTKDTKKLMDIQKKALDLNMKYMMSSFKSTLYTFIPIIIIFAWLNTHIAYNPLMPNQDFKVYAQFGSGAKGNISIESLPELKIDSSTKEIVDEKVQWTLNGDTGEYKLTFKYGTEEYSKNIKITNERIYEQPDYPIRDSKLKMIKIGNEVIHPFGKSFNIFGWYPGWLAAYIILSLVFSSLFRKIFKVY